ncbi:uncharacterized protein LOC127283675 [Leptopilina boulardi]|uniref:uncharacterized protein LOC127283675 n=1 Tax=Leptopilina boulardi TaxID=63433 RepID=UPI0021F62AFC|nr:uncharacterized protein LOC127283675 [Leptopilina boulardi]
MISTISHFIFICRVCKQKSAIMTDGEIPIHLIEESNLAIQESLPDKSRVKYEATYDTFVTWQEKQGTQSFAEADLLSYFHQLGEKYKPSTLRSIYSMLKTTINNKKNIDIKNYKQLLAFLKKKNTGYNPKKSEVLTSDQIEQFLKEADDTEYLDIKVVLIIGVYGACRGGELCNLIVDDVKDIGSSFLIKIPDTKTHRPRSFVIESEDYQLVKKYMDLRPKDVKTSRFFLNYQKGRCTQQVIGKNKIGHMPQKIARYLGLEEPESYTGHSFRRSSTTMLAERGADMLSIKNHGG